MFLTNLPLLIPLPILLIASAFFSGSETALFGLTQGERLAIQRRGNVVSAAVRGLLKHPRMLLITVLLGNMMVNVLYFVLSSVLLMNLSKADVHPLLLITIPPTVLILLIMFGEVLPKLIAGRDRQRWISFTAVPLYALHRLLAPLRIVVDVGIIEPLTRLTAPATRAKKLEAAELEELLRLSADRGVIDDSEERLLSEVVQMSSLKVRDIMVPRTEIHALPFNADREVVLHMVEETRLTQIPVYDSDLDHITGMLHVKRYLGTPRTGSMGEALSPAVFVPEISSVENLVHLLRRESVSVAIAVDEFGGTAGLVTIEDAMEPLLGQSTLPGAQDIQPNELIQKVSADCWRVSGRMRIRDWEELLGTDARASGVSTLGGLIVSLLGRLPRTGDELDIGSVHIRVEEVQGVRVVWALLSLEHENRKGET